MSRTRPPQESARPGGAEPKRPWRDLLPVHEAAELFPPMTPDELQALAEDIRKHGVIEPVVLWAETLDSDEMSLLDGRSRMDAAQVVGITIWDEKGALAIPHARRYGADTECGGCGKSHAKTNPFEYVVSANIHRRHLSPDDKRRVIEKLLKADPTKSDRLIAAQVKASPTTVGTVRAGMEARGDVSKLDTRTDSKGREQPARKPAPPKAPSPEAPKVTPPSNKPTGDLGHGPAEAARRVVFLERAETAKHFTHDLGGFDKAADSEIDAEIIHAARAAARAWTIVHKTLRDRRRAPAAQAAAPPAPPAEPPPAEPGADLDIPPILRRKPPADGGAS